MVRITVLSLVPLALSACQINRAGTAPPKTAVLSWTRYRGLTEEAESALYWFDGEFKGIGRNGFENALDEVRRLPLGSTLRLVWDPKAYPYPRGAGPGYWPPYGTYGDRLDRVCDERHLRIELVDNGFSL